MQFEIDGTTILVIVNIAAVAFTFGALNQKVKEVCRRVTRIENKINGNPGEGSSHDKKC